MRWAKTRMVQGAPGARSNEELLDLLLQPLDLGFELGALVDRHRAGNDWPRHTARTAQGCNQRLGLAHSQENALEQSVEQSSNTPDLHVDGH